MNTETHTHFAENYVPTQSFQERAKTRVVPENDVQVFMCKDLEAEVIKYENQGFYAIGCAEFVGRGNQGIGLEARRQAVAVGAALVLFILIPAKMRSIRKTAQGHIDLDAVRADPPASLSPGGYSVLKSVFLAQPISNEA